MQQREREILPFAVTKREDITFILNINRCAAVEVYEADAAEGGREGLEGFEGYQAFSGMSRTRNICPCRWVGQGMHT